MSEKIQSKQIDVVSERPNKYLRRTYTLLLLLVISLFIWRIFCYKSPQEQLMEIEAFRAIPDSENAAIYYNKLITDSNNFAVFNELRSHAPPSYYLPWKSNSDPEGSAILRKNRLWIDKLIDTSKIKDARFSIYPEYIFGYGMEKYIREASFILSWAGANDLGENRIDQAMDKFTSITRISFHLYQQPVRTYNLSGTAIEAVGLRNIRDITMCRDITKEQLMFLDTIVSQTKNYIDQNKELEGKIERLLNAKQSTGLPFITRIRKWYIDRYVRKAEEKRWQEILHRRISTQRAGRILIALRLFQIQNLRWPEPLNEIESSLPDKTFIDEMNNSYFVYKLTGDGFVLYSKGPDNIDNNHKTGSDDVIFWPTLQYQNITKKSETDLNHSN